MAEHPTRRGFAARPADPEHWIKAADTPPRERFQVLCAEFAWWARRGIGGRGGLAGGRRKTARDRQ